ncbi:protein of unknown function [Hyphomicrobium sp. MC1]|nr:protein of unknown function [Hyphomicrobium sp. MC1]
MNSRQRARIQRISRTYDRTQLSPEFFDELEKMIRLRLIRQWRNQFLDLCLTYENLFRFDDDQTYFRIWKKGRHFERHLLLLYQRAGGQLRGSWGADRETLDGPMFRFLRAVYPVLPSEFKPKSANELCNRCRLLLRSTKKKNRARENSNENGTLNK